MKNIPSTSGCADILKAIGDATRLQVLQVLLNGPLHVNDLQEKLGTEQSLLSHHLKVLREAGLVESTRRGTWAFYRLVPEALGALRGALGA